MPRPNSKRGATTMSANPQSSLADALGMARPDLQAAAQAVTCAAAPVPLPVLGSDDVDSDAAGLSEDEGEDIRGNSSSPLPNALRRDILHDRQQAFRAVVAPMATCIPAASANHHDDDDDSDDNHSSISSESVPTRPASVDHHHVPSASPEALESSSTPSKPVLANGYSEDDWDRPTGQTSFWYDDQLYYEDLHQAELTGAQPMHLPFVTQAAAPVEDVVDMTPAPVLKPRRLIVPAAGFYGQLDYESEEESAEEAQDTRWPAPLANQQPGSSISHQQERRGSAAPEPEDLGEGDVDYTIPQRQPTEPDQSTAITQQQQYQDDYAEGQHYHPSADAGHRDEEECNSYNVDCPCEVCLDTFMAQQRSDINARWSHRFPIAVPRPRTQQQQQVQVQPKHPRGSKGGNPNAVVACCYFKQKGFCKMGSDCWYSHDADASTPCHYGALCKAAGHKQLVKNGSTVPPAQRHQHQQNHQSSFVSHSTMASMSQVVPRARATIPVTAKPATAPRPAALLVPSTIPCAFCGASSLQTQDFPVYNGNIRTVGMRAHCTECLRTYAL